MSIFGGSPPQSIFYVYGNVKFRIQIENEITQITETFFELPQPKFNLVGYKVVCYSNNDIARLDVNLSKYEGWIQGEKRRDYEDIEPGYTNFDKFATGCNYRFHLTGQEFEYFAQFTKNDYLAIRYLALKNTSLDMGEYTIEFNDSDKIHGYVLPESITENNNIYLKKLNDEQILITLSNASLEKITLEAENIFGSGCKDFKDLISFYYVDNKANIIDGSLSTYANQNLDFINDFVYNVLPDKKYFGFVFEFTTQGNVDYDLIIEGVNYTSPVAVFYDYASNHILSGSLSDGGKLKSGEKYFMFISAAIPEPIKQWSYIKDTVTYNLDFVSAKIFDVTVI